MGERRDQPGWVEAWWTLAVLIALSAAVVIANKRADRLDRRLTAIEAAQKGEQK